MLSMLLFNCNIIGIIIASCVVIIVIYCARARAQAE